MNYLIPARSHWFSLVTWGLLQRRSHTPAHHDSRLLFPYTLACFRLRLTSFCATAYFIFLLPFKKCQLHYSIFCAAEKKYTVSKTNDWIWTNNKLLSWIIKLISWLNKTKIFQTTRVIYLVIVFQDTRNQLIFYEIFIISRLLFSKDVHPAIKFSLHVISLVGDKIPREG